MKGIVSSKKEQEPRKGVNIAREEGSAVRSAVSEGDKYMKDTKEPFCSACLWEEFNKVKKLAEMNQGLSGEEYVMPEVPDWHKFAGKDKFNFVKQNERKIRRDHVISIEQNYSCLARNHGVCIMDERPYVTEIPVERDGIVSLKK